MIRAPTREEIAAAQTPQGGFVRADLESWGASWPPQKGWRRRLEDQSDELSGKKMPILIVGPLAYRDLVAASPRLQVYHYIDLTDPIVQADPEQLFGDKRPSENPRRRGVK
jgi:hypothetical protein